MWFTGWGCPGFRATQAPAMMNGYIKCVHVCACVCVCMHAVCCHSCVVDIKSTSSSSISAAEGLWNYIQSSLISLPHARTHTHTLLSVSQTVLHRVPNMITRWYTLALMSTLKPKAGTRGVLSQRHGEHYSLMFSNLNSGPPPRIDRCSLPEVAAVALYCHPLSPLHASVSSAPKCTCRT